MTNFIFRKSAKAVLSAVTTATIVLYLGCTSYRFTGKALLPINEHQTVRNRYRIVRLVFEYKTQFPHAANIVYTDPWSIPQIAARTDTESIRLKLMQRHSEVFADDAASIPVAVKVLTTSENKNYTASIVVPYLLSLGTMPAWWETVSTCEAVVSIESPNAPKQRRLPLSFTSIAKLTLWSPFGLIEFDDKSDVNSQRKGADVMRAPHLNEACLDSLCDVVTETLSDVAAYAVMQMDAEMQAAK